MDKPHATEAPKEPDNQAPAPEPEKPAPPAPEPEKKGKKKVSQLADFRPSPDEKGFCSGTHIGKGLILTAGHCAHEAGTKIETSNGAKYESEMLWANEHYDVALFYSEDLGLYTKAANIDCRRLVQGEPIWSINNPLGQRFLRQTGYALESAELGEVSVPKSMFEVVKTWAEHQLVILPGGPGSSGGPVFDAHDNLVGVIVGQFNDQQTMLIVVPATAVCRLLAR